MSRGDAIAVAAIMDVPTVMFCRYAPGLCLSLALIWLTIICAVSLHRKK